MLGVEWKERECVGERKAVCVSLCEFIYNSWAFVTLTLEKREV